MTDGVAPIGADEHRGRLARAQALLATSGLDAVVVGPGSSLRYFAGAEWGLSERFLGFVLRRTGDPVWIAPAFERDRAREQIHVGSDVRTWEEDESPYALVAQALPDGRCYWARRASKRRCPSRSRTGSRRRSPPRAS